MKQIYRSMYSGQQIDHLLSSISTKIDVSAIANDLNGGVNRVASAEQVKLLAANLSNSLDPAYLKSIILTIPDFNIYDNNSKLKLDSLNDNFKGVYDTVSDRNMIDTTLYTGKELVFVKDNGASPSQQLLSFWKVLSTDPDTGLSTGVWQEAELTKPIISITTTGSSPLYPVSFDVADIKVVRGTIYASKSSNFQVEEFLISTNGVDSYYTGYNFQGNSTSLFTAAVSRLSTTCRLSLTGLTSGTSISIQIISEF